MYFSQNYVNVGKNKVVSQQLFKASQHHLLLYLLRRMHHSFEKRICFAYTPGSLLCIRPRCIVVDLYLTSPAVSRIHQCMHRRLYTFATNMYWMTCFRLHWENAPLSILAFFFASWKISKVSFIYISQKFTLVTSSLYASLSFSTGAPVDLFLVPWQIQLFHVNGKQS